MGNCDGGPSCDYPRCKFDPQANPLCARVCKAFGNCSGPCSDPCYIISSRYPMSQLDAKQDFLLS